MKPPAPARVGNVELYWTNPPPEVSDRCLWWCDRIRSGWRKNNRINKLGYDGRASYFGVYIWEQLHVLDPLLDQRTGKIA